MEMIENRVLSAQNNGEELNQLLADYLPFIKKQLPHMSKLGYDDMLSVAMLTFVNCVKQYTENRGSFLHFAAVSIKNRIIDEYRKEQRYAARILPLYRSEEQDDNVMVAADEKISILQYSRELEQRDLKEEIESLSSEIAIYNIKFTELTSICPKQERSRTLCFKIAKAVTVNGSMKANLLVNHRLSQNELAVMFNISVKTLEKYRKYIVFLAVLLMGEYPSVRAFLPQNKEVV